VNDGRSDDTDTRLILRFDSSSVVVSDDGVIPRAASQATRLFACVVDPDAFKEVANAVVDAEKLNPWVVASRRDRTINEVIVRLNCNR